MPCDMKDEKGHSFIKSDQSATTDITSVMTLGNGSVFLQNES